MSHRTEHLPEATGLRRVVREIRYKESARQILGFVYVFVATAFGDPALPAAWAAIPIVLAGVTFRLWSSGHIMKNAELATDGPYAIVRHPLYTGNIVLLAGFAIGASAIWAYVILAIFLVVFYPTAIEYEDYKLENLFGEQWRAWSKNTPALIPRRLPFGRGAAGRWSLETSMGRHYEPVIAVILTVCLIVLFIK